MEERISEFFNVFGWGNWPSNRDEYSGDELRFKDFTFFVFDVSGSTASMNKGYTRETQIFLDDFFSRALDIISIKGNGICNKFLGDGVFCVYPMDKFEECVKHAYIITELCDQMTHNNPMYSKLSIGGVHSAIFKGSAYEGLIGSHCYKDFSYLGDIVNKTFRVASKAEPGQILIDKETAGYLPGTFFHTAINPLKVKGIDKDVNTSWLFHFNRDGSASISTCDQCLLCEHHSSCLSKYFKGRADSSNGPRKKNEWLEKQTFKYNHALSYHLGYGHHPQYCCKYCTKINRDIAPCKNRPIS